MEDQNKSIAQLFFCIPLIASQETKSSMMLIKII